MLRLTAELADAWDGGMTPVDEAHEILGKVDAACHAAGRDPKTLERSLEALVCTIPEAADEPPEKEELRGTPDELAAALLRYAPLGIDHLIITTNPQTVDGVRAFGPIIEAMR